MRALALTLALVSLAACGGSKDERQISVPVPTTARWEDAFERIPPLLAVVHPQALRRDKVYGPLLKRLSQLAATRSAAVAATRTMEALESCEEIIVGMDEEGAGALVLRGVRADIDPTKLVDTTGATVWRGQGGGGKVPEYVHEESGVTASLFVLPERTWFITVGVGRDFAREAFAHPSGRPALKYDADALVSVRMQGPALLRHVKQLRAHGALEALGTKLVWANLALAPGKDGAISATLAYSDEESAARAEVTAKHVVDVLRDKKVEWFGWLFDAKIARDDPKVVTVRAPLPPQLLKGLERANDARDLDDPDLPE